MTVRQLVLRGCAGLIFGLILWTIIQEPYAAVLSAISEPVIHLTERPAVTELRTTGGETIVNRRDFPSRFQRPAMSMPQVTFNIILLAALFATALKPFSDRNMLRFLYALLILIPIHVLAVMAHVKSLYAVGFGAWSLEHYGVFARNFWSALDHFYKIFGSHAAAVGLWFALSTDRVGLARAEEPATPPKRRR